MLGGSAVALALWVGARLPLRGREGRLRLRRRDGGVEVLGSPWARPQELLGAVVVLVAAVGALLALPDGQPGSAGTVAVAVLATVAAWRFVRATRVLALERRRNRLVLDPEGVEVSGVGGRGSVPWTVLTGIGSAPLALEGHEGSRLVVPAGELLSDPALVARLLEHYLERPGHRAELGDERVLHRVAGWTSVPTPTRRRPRSTP